MKKMLIRVAALGMACLLAWAAWFLLGESLPETVEARRTVETESSRSFEPDFNVTGRDPFSAITPIEVPDPIVPVEKVETTSVADAEPAASAMVVDVTDKFTGNPVSGAHVRITARDLANDSLELGVFEKDTDETGRACLYPAIGFLDIVATSTEGKFGRVQEVHSGADSAGPVHVEMEPLATIRGVVLDGRFNAPIADAELSNIASTALGTARVVTDEHGQFDFGAWKMGAAATLSIEAPGYGKEHITLLVDQSKGWAILGEEPDIEWKSDEPFLEITLDPERIVRGRAVRSDGSVVSGAKVRAIGYYRSSFAISVPDAAECSSDEHGEFELAGLRSDLAHVILCEEVDEGIGVGIVAGERTDAGDVVVSPFATVVGVLSDPVGQPVCGAKIELEVADYSSVLGSEFAGSARSALSSFRTETQVGADGRFVASGVPGAEALLVARLGTRELVNRKVLLEPGRNDVGSLATCYEMNLARGWIVDSNGEPHPDGRVEVLEPDGRLYGRVEVGRAGQFRLALIPDYLDDMLLVAIDRTGRTLCRWKRNSREFPVSLRLSDAVEQR